MYSEITAQQIMARKLITLKPYDSIYDGLKQLLTNKISGAPVVDDNGKFLGLFTEKSCMNVIIADQYHGNKNTHVESFMYKDVMTISPDTGLTEIGMLFVNGGWRRLPVVVEDGTLQGQVSRRDVLRAIDNERKQATRKSKPPTAIPYYSAVVDPRSSNENNA